MKQFLVMYYASAEGIGAMANATPEQKAEGMKPWMEWKAEHDANIINFGAPLLPGNEISMNKDWKTSEKQVSGFSIIQAKDGEEAKNMLVDHPHNAMNENLSVGLYPFISM